MAVSRRGRRLLLAAGLLLILVLLYLLLRSASPPPLPAPPAALQAPQPPPPAPSPPAPAPDVSGLRLHGLLASGAIIGFQNGNQRLVLVGREALPGLTLQRIEQNHAVFASSAGGEARLGFDGPGQAPAAAPPALAARRDESLPYRLGLAPRRAGGRVTGFTVRRGASLPALDRAGLRPGDVIVAVNGSAFDEERMLDLPWQIANSTRTEIEVERGGRRVRMALEGR